MGRDRARRAWRGGRDRDLLSLTPNPLKAGDPALASLLGRLFGLWSDGRAEDAGALETALIRRGGAEPRLWAGLSQVYRRLGRTAAVVAMSRRAADLAPTDADLRLGHARALLDEGRVAAARLELDTAAACGSIDPTDVLNHAALCAQAFVAERGRAPLVAALQAHPRDARLLVALAIAERAEGDLSAARDHALEAASAAGPSGEALWLAADLASASPPEWFPRVLAEAVRSRDADRARLAGFALGRLEEARGDPAAAFAHVLQASRASRRGFEYEVGVDVGRLDAICRRHSRAAVRAAPLGVADPTPVFVVGLPRTGTTLVERILGAHSEARALGEPPAFERALQDHVGRPDASSLPDDRLRAIGLDLHAVGLAYLTETEALGGAARRRIDKRPANILNVGLILSALPAASVIVVERDPIDAAWALFKTPFADGAHRYSYDLGELGRYVAAHHRLTEHWRELRDPRILFVRYEVIVRDLETQARRMVAHCGLQWEPACLHFELNAAPATTASATAVRRPIFSSSVGSGVALGERLAPFRASYDVEAARQVVVRD